MTQLHLGSPLGSAVLSPCGTYRYVLTREWGGDPALVAIGLNPSTADASVTDPTTARLVKLAAREGRGRLVLLNLFALRNRDPAVLDVHADPVGPDWHHHTSRVLDAVQPGRDLVLAAWGASGPGDRTHYQVGQVRRALQARGLAAWCLGWTAAGWPRHPLYVRADAPLRPWGPS